MVQVSVKPESFEMVFYDVAVIGEVVAEVAERLGVDEAITLDIDENSPLGRSKILSYDPIGLWVDGGALELAVNACGLTAATSVIWKLGC